jgi:hypothetical protein
MGSHFEEDSIWILLDSQEDLKDVLSPLGPVTVTAAAAVGDLSAVRNLLTVQDDTQERNLFHLINVASITHIRFLRHPLHAAAATGKTDVLLYLVKRFYSDYLLWLETSPPPWLLIGSERCSRIPMYGSLATAIMAGHEDTVTKVVLLIATLLPLSFKITYASHIKFLVKAVI